MNRVVVIVGASSGIGYEVARLFVKDGDRVYNLSRHASPHPMVHSRIMDASNITQITEYIDDIYYKEKDIDMLIYCAGFSMAVPHECVQTSDYKYLIDVNLMGAMESIKAVIPYMKIKGGRIITISSMGAVLPIPYDPYYSASKAALNMFIECLNLQLRNTNIKASSIMPGGTKTPFSFKRKIYSCETGKDYDKSLTNAVDKLFNMEQKGMAVEKVAKIIYDTATMEHPPMLISCGMSNKIRYTLSKFSPKWLTHLLIKWIYKV